LTQEAEPTQTNESAEQLEQALRKSSKLQGAIDTSLVEMQTTFVRTGQSIQEKEREINSKIDGANQAIKDMQTKANESINVMDSELKRVSSRVDETYQKLETLCTYMIIAFLFAYYLGYFFVFQLTYDVVVFGGVIIAAITALAFRIMLHRVGSQIQENKSAMFEHLAKAHKALGAFWAKKLALEPGLQRINDGFVQATRYGQAVLSAARDYIPSLSTMYASKERINRQIEFIKTLRNALTRYGFRLNSKVNDYLSWFGPLTNSDIEWVQEASARLSAIIGTPRQNIVLAYADYTGDGQLARNIWCEYKDNSLVASLAQVLISNKVVETEYFEDNPDNYSPIISILSTEEPFNLDSFRETYRKFYGEYAIEKKNLIDAMRLYGFEIGHELEERTKKLVPRSFEEDERLECLFDLEAAELGVCVDLVKLAYFEHEGDRQRRVQVWEKIRHERNDLNALCVILVDHKLIETQTQYEPGFAGITEFVSSAVEPLSDFTISRARISVRQKFTSLDETKRNFSRSLKFNKIEFDERELLSWLPLDFQPNVVAEWIESRTDISSCVALLFYYDYVQDRRRKEQFATLKESGNLQELSEVLIKNELVRVESEKADSLSNCVTNLTLLLKRLEDYDRSEIQITFSVYNRLLDYSKGLVEFLRSQGFVSNSLGIDFSRIIGIVDVSQTDLLEELKLIVADMIREHAEAFLDWYDSATLATTTLHLVLHRDILQADACMLSAVDPKASRILYQFSRVNDEEEQKGIREKEKLVDIIKKTIDGTYNNYDYFTSFQKELQSGFLYQRISHLLEARLRSIDEKITDKVELEKKIKTYSGAVNTFLESKLKANVILESLRMQLVSAYMITNPSAGNVITGIIDNCLEEACAQLSYRGFLLLSDESFGRGTRVGIVPFLMDFTEFSARFEKAFRLAVEKNVKPGDKHKLEDFSGNLIRIFPSDAYFKRIDYEVPAKTETEDNEKRIPSKHPIQIIRKLVLEHYGPVENLELLASLQSTEDKTIAMKSLLRTFFDANSTLYLMAESQINCLISGSKFLDYVKSGKLDQDFVSMFGCNTRSELALTIYKASGTEAKKALLIKQKLATELIKIVHFNGAKLTDEQINGLGSSIYQVLFDVGLVLNGFSVA
jgi:hypothetical protein